MEDFGIQIRQIGHHKDEDRLDDSYVVGKPCHQPGKEAPDYTCVNTLHKLYQHYVWNGLSPHPERRKPTILTDDGATEGNHKERRNTRNDIHHLDVVGANLIVRLEHVIHHNLFRTDVIGDGGNNGDEDRK